MLMGSQIDELLEKYWKGESSLEEERLIKSHFKDSPTLGNESNYFQFVSETKAIKYQHSRHSYNHFRTWMSAAATITIGVITAILVFSEAKKDPFAEEDPQKALAATRNALMMIGSGLNEGQVHAMNLTKFNKAREELQSSSEKQ